MPRYAPQPPMPADPTVCRWCGNRRIALPDLPGYLYCANGCADNDRAPYLGHCQDCGREFETGRAFPVLCYPCDSKEHAQHVGASVDQPVTGYAFDKRRDGANRHVMAAMRKDVA